MTKLTHNRAVHGLLIGLLGSLLGLSGSAFAQLTATEPATDTAADAPLLCISSGGISITGVSGDGTTNQTTDVDIYAFDGTANNTPDIGVTTDHSWDSYLVLYDETGAVLAQNDDIDFLNTDSAISAYTLPYTGRYYVAIVGVPNYISENFTLNTPGGLPAQGGAYTLDISGVTSSLTTASIGGTASNGSCTPVAEEAPSVPDPVVDTGGGANETLGITIEVLHWRNQDGDVAKRWKHHLKRKGKRDGIYPIPVVMFSSDSVTADNIDESSLRFGVSGEDDSMFRCSKRGMDVNKDGRKDKVCFFDAFKTGFDVGDVEGVLTGKTVDGDEFVSEATLKVYKLWMDPKDKHNHKRKHMRRSHRHDDHDRYKRSRWSR